MKISFYKTGELNGSSYIKIPLRSSALLNFKDKNKHCFIWSILASLVQTIILIEFQILKQILMN